MIYRLGIQSLAAVQTPSFAVWEWF